MTISQACQSQTLRLTALGLGFPGLVYRSGNTPLMQGRFAVIGKGKLNAGPYMSYCATSRRNYRLGLWLRECAMCARLLRDNRNWSSDHWVRKPVEVDSARIAVPNTLDDPNRQRRRGMLLSFLDLRPLQSCTC